MFNKFSLDDYDVLKKYSIKNIVKYFTYNHSYKL